MRDGSGNYVYPPGTEGVPDQTIESIKYNTFIADIQDELNDKLPVHRGGTGSSSSNEAMTTLGGERATQLVTNYDSHVWLPGSFRSDAAATGSPINGHAFAGICYIGEPLAAPPTNANVTVLARDQNDTTKPGRMYLREKKAGVWDPWKGEDRIVVSPTPPSLLTTPDGGLWWDNDNGILYISYNDGNTTQWVQVVAVPYVDTELFLKKAGDTMTGLLTLSDNPEDEMHAATKQYVDGGVAGIPGKVSKAGDVMTGLLTLSGDPVDALHAVPKRYAAPLDALAYSGMQVNGSMEVSQELGTGGRSTSGYVCDGWYAAFPSAGLAMGIYQGASIGFFPGLSNLIYTTVTTAKPALAAADLMLLEHYIEGYRIARLGWGYANAKPITIGFWTGHKRPGVYSVAIRNGAQDRSYTTTYTHAVSDVAQYNVITIPGDVTGTWPVTSAKAMIVTFALACGTTYTAPIANVWSAGTYVAAPGQVNAIAATTDNFRIGGVVVLSGIYAPTAAQSPLIMRPYDQELVTCQRYFRWLPFNMYFHAYVANEVMGTTMLFPPMRVAPSIGAIQADPNLSQVGINSVGSAFGSPTPYSVHVVGTANAVGVYHVTGYRAAADARL